MSKLSANTKIASKTQRDTTVLVKAATPFVSAVKRIDTILEKFDKQAPAHRKYKQGDYKAVKYIVVKGMGNAMQKTVSLGLHFETEKQYKTDVYTGSVEVMDQVKTGEVYETKDESDEETELQARKVSFVEIRVWLKRK